MSILRDSKGGSELVAEWDKKKIKESAYKAAEELEKHCNLGFLSRNIVAEMLKGAVRGNELKVDERHRVRNLKKWFLERGLSNSVKLTKEDYITAMGNSLELLILGKVSRMDFGPRRRDLGQRWTDFVRGYLGEIALRKYLRRKWGAEVKLEQREIGKDIGKDPQDYIPTDITGIRDARGWRDVEKTLSIKTTKLGNVWLWIPKSQFERSDAFASVKIGIPFNHLAVFLKETRALDKILEAIKTSGGGERVDTNKIRETIPDFSNIPAYIPGFAWKEEFMKGNLETSEGVKHLHVVGGIGNRSTLPSPPSEKGKVKVKPFGGKPNEEYMATPDRLRWKEEDWSDLLEAM